MNYEDIVPGMKVVPNPRTVLLDLSVIWRVAQRRGQHFLYVVGFKTHGDTRFCILSDDKNGQYTGTFRCQDLKAYECSIVNGPKYWTLKSDKGEFYFTGRDFAEYLKELHEKLGYEVTIDYEYYEQFEWL